MHVVSFLFDTSAAAFEAGVALAEVYSARVLNKYYLARMLRRDSSVPEFSQIAMIPENYRVYLLLSLEAVQRTSSL